MDWSTGRLRLVCSLSLGLAAACLLAVAMASAGQESAGRLGPLQDRMPPIVELSDMPTKATIVGSGGYGYSDDGDNLWTIAGGDVNGDGFEDLILGAPGANVDGRMDSGEVYIIFGGSGLPGYAVASTVADVVIEGIAPNDGAGVALTSADIDGDTYDEVIIASSSASPGGRASAGEVYIVYGSSSMSSTIALSSSVEVAILEGAYDSGYGLLRPSSSYGFLDLHMATGDVDQDNLDDLIVGFADAAPGGRQDAGAVYVVYGRNRLTGRHPLSTTPEVLTLEGVNSGDGAGFMVHSGDLDGDGHDDVLIGAPWAQPGGRNGAGETYVVYGRNRFTGTYQVTAMTDVLTLEGVNEDDKAGGGLGTGDVDGLSGVDLVIGATGADPGGRTGAGEVYVIYGPGHLTGTHQISTMLNVAVLEGVDGGLFSGDSIGHVLLCSKLDGDAMADIIIGAPLADPDGRNAAGEVYVVYGSSDITGTIPLSTPGSAAVSTIRGIDPGDFAGDGVGVVDMNDDQELELVISSYLANPDGNEEAGEVYVFRSLDKHVFLPLVLRDS